MLLKTKKKLVEAWNWCDSEDKSTEFMFAYMADFASVTEEVAINFVVDTSYKERIKITNLK